MVAGRVVDGETAAPGTDSVAEDAVVEGATEAVVEAGTEEPVVVSFELATTPVSVGVDSTEDLTMLPVGTAMAVEGFQHGRYDGSVFNVSVPV